MNSLPPSQLLSALRWRYATKKYDRAKKIPADTWHALEQSLVLAPSSYGLQPWKFLVVDDVAVRQKLVAAAYGQTQPGDASHYVVFAVRRNLGDDHIDRHIARTAAVRGMTTETLAPFRNVMSKHIGSARAKGTLDTWQSHQIYIALGQFMAAAALLGVDTTPMEGLDAAKYDEILGLKGTDYATLCACAAGYRAADDKYATIPKVRFETKDVVVHV
ncbi:MAG TPA: NAD(P)H-dependent oxidoreductase [Opitutaceae bacterium]